MAFMVESKRISSVIDDSEFYLVYDEDEFKKNLFFAVIDPKLRYFDLEDALAFEREFEISPLDELALLEARMRPEKSKRLREFVREREKKLPSLSKNIDGVISLEYAVKASLNGAAIFFWGDLEHPQTIKDIMAWEWNLAYKRGDGEPILLEDWLLQIQLFSPKKLEDGILEFETTTGKKIYVRSNEYPPVVVSGNLSKKYSTDIYSVIEDGLEFEGEDIKKVANKKQTSILHVT